MFRKVIMVALATAAVAACDSGTDVDGAANVGIYFATPSQQGSAIQASPAMAPYTSTGSIVVGGSNGSLTIDAIHVVVAEFELEGALAACDETFDDDDCEEVESGPFLVEIPTDGEALRVATAWVPLGSYTELEWEVEDLDFDDDDFDGQDVQTVRADIDALVGAGVWPEEASMVVTGSFLAEGETTPTPFTTFFAAEIEVEMDLVPPLDLNEEGASRELTIVLSPDVWFRNADGSVMNLAALSNQVVEFEAEFEDGILEIEIDDDDDDESEDPDAKNPRLRRTGDGGLGYWRDSILHVRWLAPSGSPGSTFSFPLPRDLRLGAPLARGFSCGQSPRSRLAPSPNPGRAASRKPSLPEATSAGLLSRSR